MCKEHGSWPVCTFIIAYCSYTGHILLSVTINSGILCVKSKIPGRTVYSLFHTAHSNVMVILRYLLYGYTGFRKHINPYFVYSESRFGKLLP